jgi:hypothetical protein
MQNGIGRSAVMQQGAEAVREPQFHTMQLAANSQYRKTSVLDSLLPSGNGRSALDRQRLIYGVDHSAIGQADSTFESHLYLRPERPVSLYSQTSDQQ